MNESLEKDQLFQAALLGVDAEKFLSSPVGVMLWKRADEKIERASRELITVDPFDSAKIRELQNDAKLGAMFKTWMVDAIDDGNNAMTEMEREDRPE
jgi:hypothetical protein